jgi:aminoglycoside phosphotransferase (APT) family kinase protein
MPVLLLEDLSTASAGDALTGSGIAEVRRVLHAMAPVWSHGVRGPARRLPRWGTDPTAWRERQQRYSAQWDTVAQALHRQLPDPVRALGRRLRDHLAGRVLAPLADAAHTVVHTDLHLDNMLFAGADQHPVVIDWPSVCIGPVAVDVFPFLATSLPPHEYDRHAAATIDDLSRHYRRRCGRVCSTTAVGHCCGTSPASSAGSPDPPPATPARPPCGRRHSATAGSSTR